MYKAMMQHYNPIPIRFAGAEFKLPNPQGNKTIPPLYLSISPQSPPSRARHSTPYTRRSLRSVSLLMTFLLT